jgi:hypothetical protein
VIQLWNFVPVAVVLYCASRQTISFDVVFVVGAHTFVHGEPGATLRPSIAGASSVISPRTVLVTAMLVEDIPSSFRGGSTPDVELSCESVFWQVRNPDRSSWAHYSRLFHGKR